MLWRFPLVVCLVLQVVVAERSPDDVCVCDCSRCSQVNNQTLTTAATKYEAPKKNPIALKYGSKDPQPTEASRQQDPLLRGLTPFIRSSRKAEKSKEERGADIGRLVSDTKYQNMTSADTGGGEHKNSVNKFSNAEGNETQSETATTAATKYEALKENNIALRYDSQDPQLEEARRQPDPLLKGSTQFKGYSNEPEKKKEDRGADIGRVVSNTNYQNMHSADAGGGEYKNGFNKFSNGEGDGREFETATTAAMKYEAPKENNIALRYDSRNPQLEDAKRQPDPLLKGSTQFKGYSIEPEKIKVEKGSDTDSLVVNDNHQNKYSADGAGGEYKNGVNKFSNAEGDGREFETATTAATKYEALKENNIALRYDSQHPQLTEASRHRDPLSRDSTPLRGFLNEPGKIKEERRADIGRLVPNTNYQNKYSADAVGGEYKNGSNKFSNGEGDGRESETATTAATKYEAPKENNIALRYGSQNYHFQQPRQEQDLLSRDSTPFRGYSSEAGVKADERRADINSLVSNFNHQNMYNADAGGGKNKNGFNKLSNAEGVGRESEPFFNSLIERVAVELSNSLEAELRALQRDRVDTERLRNARMQHAAVVAVTRLDNAFTQLAKSPVGVDNVIEKIMVSVRRNIRQTGNGFEQSSKEKALQNIPLLMKMSMKTF